MASNTWKVTVRATVDVRVEVGASTATGAKELAKACAYDSWLKRQVLLMVEDGQYEAEVLEVSRVGVAREEYKFCDRCGHLDEVHSNPSHCLGGPETDCHCTGFKEIPKSVDPK